MAWIHWEHPKDGSPPRAHVKWRDPVTRKTESEALGAVDALTAEVERQRVRQAIEGKTAAAKWLTPARLRAAFFGHLKAKRTTEDTRTWLRRDPRSGVRSLGRHAGRALEPADAGGLPRPAPRLVTALGSDAGERVALVCPLLPTSRGAALHALHRLCDLAGVRRGGWHRFRHSLASAMEAAGAGVGSIGRALAHRHGSPVTLRYIRAGDEQVAAGMEAAAKELSGAIGALA